MSTKLPVVFCRDCKHSKPEPNSTWNLRCHHPEVNRKDEWALSSTDISGRGTDCRGERAGGWFAVCGRKGKLYELKEVSQ